MMIGNDEQNTQAYTEIICLLRYFPIQYIKKLPEKLLELIQNKSDEKYNITIDLDKDLKSQNISEKTKNILAVLTYNYWSDDTEKEHLKKRLYENEKVYQEVLTEKYNINNLFKKKVEGDFIIKDNQDIKNEQLVIYEESFFRKVLNKILKLLKIY